MGYTSYDSHTRSVRASSLGYHTKSREEVFRQRNIHDSLSPFGLKKRECFDSPQHPNTIAGIIGLDVTGSMGIVPQELIKDGLPHIMGNIIEKGTPDVAICFVAIGDHMKDSAPLQVAQFESGDEELDRHLQHTWLEAGGGGNGGESYALAWYFAGHHTSIDCFNKRGQKGVLITVGDENIHSNYSASSIRRMFGDTAAVESDVTAAELLAAAKKYFHVYHLGLPSSHSMGNWKELLGKNFIEINSYTEVANKVADIFLIHTKEYNNGSSFVETPTETSSDSSSKPTGDKHDALFVK